MTFPIAYQAYEIKEFFYADLVSFPTALTVEQLPLVKAHVEKLTEAIYDAGKLYKLPLVVKYNDVNYMAGGRNRLAALNELGVTDDELIPCLYTEAETSEELVTLILGDNTTRRSNAAERKTLQAAAKFGIGLTYDDISNTINTLVDIEDDTELTKEVRGDVAKLFKLMLAHAINELDADVLKNQNTALMLANSMWSNFYATKHTYVQPEVISEDGVKLTAAKKVTLRLFDYLLDCDKVSLIDNIVHSMALVLDTITLPADTQRKAASIVKASWGAFRDTINEQLAGVIQ